MHEPIEISNKTKLLEQRRTLLKKDRRKVLSGYPRATQLSIDEVREYLSQEEIDCLICGQRKKSLSAHLARIHMVSTDEYKVRFGLPFRAGLTSAGTTKSLQEVRGNDSAATISNRISKLKPASLGEKRPQRTSALKRMTALRNREMAPKTPKKYGRDDAVRVLLAVEAGEMLYPYLRKKKEIGVSAFKALLQDHHDLNERYLAIAGEARRKAMIGNKIACASSEKPV